MKSNTKLIIGIIIGVIISSGVSVVAYSLLSSDIQFTPDNNNWQVGNVEDALNSLYISRANNDYSTDEKVVGKWIDGKPIYQKTLYFANPPATNTVLISDVDKCINAWGFQLYKGNVWYHYPYESESSSSNLRWQFFNDTHEIKSLGTRTDSTEFYWTFQYTKITD